MGKPESTGVGKPESTGVGGTNLQGVELQEFSKRKSLNICKIHFVRGLKLRMWMLVPPTPVMPSKPKEFPAATFRFATIH